MIEVKTKFLRIRNPTTGEFEVLLSIKGDKGDVMDSIVQEYGDNSDKILSQAFVTSVLNDLQNSLGGVGSDILDLYSKIETLSAYDETCNTTLGELRKHCNGQYDDLFAQINDLSGSIRDANDAITALNSYYEDNKTNISNNADDIETNANNISTNAENISKNATDIEGAYSMIDRLLINIRMLNASVKQIVDNLEASSYHIDDIHIPWDGSKCVPNNQ